MTQYFKSIEEQIDILISRGLEVNDKKRAGDVLLRYNYYKIINSTLPFLTEADKEKGYKYRPGTNFEDLIEVHNFDKELKKILLSQMLEIERISRSVISYKFVEKYPENGAYLNPKNYDNGNRGFVLTNIDSIKETLENYKEEKNFNKSINYYLEKYGSVPFWFIINFLSFGRVVNIYEVLDYKLREDIADEFQVFVQENISKELKEFITPSMLHSFLNNAKDIRNIAAHDNLILGYTFDDLEYFETIHSKYGISKSDKRNRLFDTMVVLQALIPKDYYQNMEKEVDNLIAKLKDQVDEIAYNSILESIGYKK